MTAVTFESRAVNTPECSVDWSTSALRSANKARSRSPQLPSAAIRGAPRLQRLALCKSHRGAELKFPRIHRLPGQSGRWSEGFFQ